MDGLARKKPKCHYRNLIQGSTYRPQLSQRRGREPRHQRQHGQHHQHQPHVQAPRPLRPLRPPLLLRSYRGAVVAPRRRLRARPPTPRRGAAAAAAAITIGRGGRGHDGRRGRALVRGRRRLRVESTMGRCGPVVGIRHGSGWGSILLCCRTTFPFPMYVVSYPIRSALALGGRRPAATAPVGQARDRMDG